MSGDLREVEEILELADAAAAKLGVGVHLDFSIKYCTQTMYNIQ